WSGLELNFIYDHKTNHLDSSFISRALNITDPETTFTISNITGRSSTSDINQNFQSLTGDFEMKIANINFDSIDTKMNMNNLVFSGFSKTNQGKLQMGMKLTGDKMVANEYEFGPLTYNFAIKDIDATSWIKLQESANSMKSAENPMEQGMQVMGILPELVKYSPVIEIKELSLKSNQGNFDANAKVKIKADNPEMLQNILLIGNTLEAEASVVASKSLVDFYIENTSANNKAQEKSIDNENKNKVSEGAEQLSEGQDFIAGETKEEAKAADNESGIKEFIDSGYFILDGNNYVFKATLKSGLLSINGKPIPLAQMMLQ
ncbi:MAG: YdgA family protein, partial [Candidatus Dadabacteria bacterium]|nr:YdgA family protein [Candidatus Dadabacteria bacterium]NIS09600.1 YdgA family protein [Candidatus Dadabacteria bacterium]NIV43179.1 DUF945 family protein [Candidatus Dadabacteria bacterium]NIX16082.1 DUF945 family protein [Candidatus Dadabacteria bacterium]NIY22772.1 DUF945 family protein [Candidatus Dadabacteria bacterium]